MTGPPWAPRVVRGRLLCGRPNPRGYCSAPLPVSICWPGGPFQYLDVDEDVEMDAPGHYRQGKRGNPGRWGRDAGDNRIAEATRAGGVDTRRYSDPAVPPMIVGRRRYQRQAERAPVLPFRLRCPVCGADAIITTATLTAWGATY